MTEDDDNDKEQARTRRRLSLIPQLILLLCPALCSYSPGNTFWEFMLPGQAKDFESHSFEANYLGEIPNHIGDKVDSILIDWLTQKITCTESVERMEEVIAELSGFQRQPSSRIDDEREVDLIPGLVDSLLSMIHDILPFDEERTSLAAIISRFRTRYYNADLGSGDHSLGHN